MSQTESLHQLAETTREQDRHLDALKLYQEVILGYQREQNYSGLVEALGGQCLTYKHLFLLSQDHVFYIVAKHSAQAALDVALQHNINSKLHRCYFRLGEMEMLVNNFSGAIDYYQKSLDLYPQEEAEKGDFQYHLGEALSKSGNHSGGLQNMLAGVALIQKYAPQTDSFLIHVWESGAYMRLAECLWVEDQKQARGFLTHAQTIIDSDSRLIIRHRQLEELKKNLSTRSS